GNAALLRPMMTLPLAIGGVCVVTSIIGTFFVKLGPSQSIMGALYKGFIVTAVLSLVGEALVIYFLLPAGFGAIQGATYTGAALFACGVRSEEHTSELQSRVDLVCRLLLEKK